MTERKNAPPGSPWKRRWRWIVGGGLLVVGAWFLVTDSYREEEKELRTRLRETVKETFPEEAAAHSESFGLRRFEPNAEAPDGAGRGTVVLVHGLDDPGLVWRSLAPALAREGFDVRLLEYPNDQPIVESVALFFEEMVKLRAGGTDRVAVVAHSMGGLVTREMLTSPEAGFPDAVRAGRVPTVVTFIMVGTPNHGSPLARLRGLAEIREQLARAAQREGSWLRGILDGAGEAKIDLLPQSRFLTALNARPLPEGVQMLSIAGVASPWSEGDIRGWVDREREEVETVEDAESLDQLEAALVSLTRGVGDGLVSVESTRLEGAEHLTVEGTHLTMIRNLTADSERVPPAVPIIVERLARGGA